jgi:hypothetical protein
MAKRPRKRAGVTWWAVGFTVVAAALLVWWLSARRAEAPGLPASQPGARALSQDPPDGHEPASDHDEITGDEKADLQRIIRERGGATPAGH